MCSELILSWTFDQFEPSLYFSGEKFQKDLAMQSECSVTTALTGAMSRFPSLEQPPLQGTAPPSAPESFAASAPAPVRRPKARKARSGWAPPTAAQTEAAARATLTETLPRFFCAHPGCFRRLGPPKSGDWLDDVCETGQTLKQFQRLSLKAVRHRAHLM